MAARARTSHYELAFEAFLDRRGTPFVAVEDVRHVAKTEAGAKLFDYIVYPAGSAACLVDVKGRKTLRRGPDGDCRQKSWVTRRDLDGLEAWQQVFGPDYAAGFVFAYWLADDPQLWDDAGGGALFAFAGRRYAFYFVPLDDYARHFKRFSKRWDTVTIPRGTFRTISRELAGVWPAAPC